MKSIELEAVISGGMGMYSELTFPKKDALPDLPGQWAQAMCPGSLNTVITRYPDNMDDLGEGYGVQKLDGKKLEAAAIVPHDMIENNALKPTTYSPERGDAQIWPCEVTVESTSKTFNAWAVRRIGSAYSDVIELMSPDKLRDKHNLSDGTKVKVKILGK